MKVAVVLLTWQRISNLKLTLDMLNKQTKKDFDIYISNGNLSNASVSSTEKYAKYFSRLGLNISISHDGNDNFTFRRFTIGRKLVKDGYDIVMYLDDDVTIDNKYIAKCLDQYEPKSYKSGYAWQFYKRGQDYYKHRKRITDPAQEVHYCGTGFSMIDASFFLEDNLFNYPRGAEKIEDLWLSYCVSQTKGWKLSYMDVGQVNLKGADRVALYKAIMSDDIDKADFLRTLVALGWKLPN